MPIAIDQQFVVLDNTQRATIESADATLYQRLNENYESFHGHTLISCYEFTQDWASWEVHPAGDEVVILLSGQATLVLQREQGLEHIELRHTNDTCVIPSNIWHTAKISATTKLLFITPGAGTQHRDV